MLSAISKAVKLEIAIMKDYGKWFYQIRYSNSHPMVIALLEPQHSEVNRKKPGLISREFFSREILLAPNYHHFLVIMSN